jgi:colicin import membrane protein
MRGKECELEIRVAASGFVISVDSGRGDALVCQTARAAVLKAGTLPVSPDPDVFKQMSTIKIRMAPYQN